MGKQATLHLVNGLQATYASAGKALLSTVERVVAEGFPKRIVLAEEIGICEQHLSDSLNDRKKHFSIKWLPAVVRRDREHRIASLIAGWQSCRLVENEPMTDAEKVRRYEAAMRRAGAAGEAIRVDAMDGEEEP